MKKKGVLYACAAAALWAVSGIVGQWLFTRYGFSAEWLVSVRLFFSGLLLLSIGLRDRQPLFAPFKECRSSIQLILFSVFGLFLVQFSYFKTIAISDAAFATIIQYTGPLFVVCYYSVKNHQWPTLRVLGWIIFTLIGVTMLATGGDVQQLMQSTPSLGWGGLSALALAFYSIQPRKLIQSYGSIVVVGWGMLIGSVPAMIIHPIWHVSGSFSIQSWGYILFVIVFGTALAYLLFLASLHFISSTLATVLTAFEPLIAALLSMVVFGASFSLIEWFGLCIVLLSVYQLQENV